MAHLKLQEVNHMSSNMQHIYLEWENSKTLLDLKMDKGRKL